MTLISVDDLRSLVEQPEGICVSLYMPTVQAGAETRQNAIRFKNLIKQAEAQLQNYEFRSTEAIEFLQPATVLDQEDFWQHQNQGLALFIGQDFLRYYQLPLPFQELVVVNSHFHLKPLMPLLTRDSDFYILFLSQKQIRFFEASRYSITEVEVPGLPPTLEEALQYDPTAKEGQFRIGTSAGHGGSGPHRAGTFHGQGAPDRDEHQKDILQYFHLVNDAVQAVLQNKQAPLVLVGIDALLPIYREANTYQNLYPEAITENLKLLRPEELHERALQVIAPVFSQAEQSAVEYYREMTPTGKTSTDLRETLPAAYYGRVEQLLVAVGVQQWGQFDPEANDLHLHAQPEVGDEDLLNAAAIQTLLNGGAVYAVEPDRVPDSAPIAAVFRY